MSLSFLTGEGRQATRIEMAVEIMAAKLESYGRSVSKAERAELARSVTQVVEFRPGQDIVREHEFRAQANVLLTGWTSRYIDLNDGRRQILALHIPGDFIDLHSYQLELMDHSVRALTPCQVAVIPHERLDRITEQYPHLTRQLWLHTLVDAAIMRQWMLGLGRRSALENTAHLLCELFRRLQAVGLSEGQSFPLPVNQIELSEALGISPVHANRTLQELRTQGLVRLAAQRAEILDLGRLEALAEFDPDYLHLAKEPILYQAASSR